MSEHDGEGRTMRDDEPRVRPRRPDAPAPRRRSGVAVVASLLTLLVLLTVPATAAASVDRPGQRPLTIAQARTKALGTVVTVEGTVTTPSGAFTSSYDDMGFGVQDRTAGIFVSFPTTNIGVGPSRHVVVTGTLTSSVNDGLLAIAPASAAGVRIGGNDRPVEPRWVRTGSVGPRTEGSLVRAVGRVTTPAPAGDGAFGSKMFIDDGSGAINVYANKGTNVDVSKLGLAVGQPVVVTGFSSQFGGKPEIDIRGPRDIVRLGR